MADVGDGRDSSRLSAVWPLADQGFQPPLVVNGALVTSSGDSIGLNPEISQPIDANGTYTLVIGTFNGAGTGEVVLIRE